MTKKRKSGPISVLDVAAYIIANHFNNTPIEAWKMHKLAYYCQAWSLVREEIPFFYEKILATHKGVMINELCPQHFNHLYVGGSSIGNLNHLSLRQVDTIDYVMKIYGKKTVDELDLLICSESPWQQARQNETSNEIDLNSMLEYYKALDF